MSLQVSDQAQADIPPDIPGCSSDRKLLAISANADCPGGSGEKQASPVLTVKFICEGIQESVQDL